MSAAEDARVSTVVDLVREAFPRRNLFPRGQLDKTSTGFVLLTDDGALLRTIFWRRAPCGRLHGAAGRPSRGKPISGFARGAAGRRQPLLPTPGRAGRGPDAAPVVLHQGVYPQIKHMFGDVRRGRAQAAAHGHWRRCAGPPPWARRLARGSPRRNLRFAGQTFMKQTKNFHICPV